MKPAPLHLIALLAFVFVFSWEMPARAQDLPAYRIVTAQGKGSSFAKLVKAAQQADVVLFGEQHNNAIAHWLQLELLKALIADQGSAKRPVALGLEMLEADQQALVSSYASGALDAESFKKKVRLWPNYATDYAPAVDLARLNGCRIWATNVPRPFASAIAKGGVKALDTLSDVNRAYAVPLPFELDYTLSQYVEVAKMMNHGGIDPKNFVAAQAIKDATMAHFILKALDAQPTALMLHLNGAFHSDRYQSINWYLKKARPSLRIVTISTVEQPAVKKLDNASKGLADFIIMVPETMTHTY